MRLCLDENAPDHVQVRLESEGHNVTLARDAAGQGASDKNLLRTCSQERRVLLTNDRDFDELHKTEHHEGILRYSVARPMREGWKEIVEGINLIDEYMDMRNELQWPAEWAKTLKE